MDLRQLQARVRENNIARGFRLPAAEQAELCETNAQIARLALITTEVAEAIEEIRAGHAVDETYYRDSPEDGVPKMEGVPSELADILIRVLDTADVWGIDLEAAIEAKMAYNATRPYQHGGKRL